MAKDNAKKALKSNGERLKLFFSITAVINVLYLLYRVWWHSNSFGILNGLGWLLLVAGEAFALKGLMAYGEAHYDDEGRLESCADLTELEGTASYLQDLLWVSWFVHGATLLSDWFWIFYTVIPVYGGYVLYNNVISPVLAMRNGMMPPGLTGGDGGAGGPAKGGSRAERRKAAQEEAWKKTHPQAKAKPRPRKAH